MKRSIQCRDRKLAFVSEKIKSHLLLFDSIEKEAILVKKVVDNVQRVVSEKEEVGKQHFKLLLYAYIPFEVAASDSS